MASSLLGPSFVLPEEEAVWDRWQCPTVEGELERLGSPLMTVPTPGREAKERRTSIASTLADSVAAQHVRVLLRVKPPVTEVHGCIEVSDTEDAVRITPPEEEDALPPRTPGRGQTPGRAEPRTPSARTPSARTPGAKTPVRTPGARTPGARTVSYTHLTLPTTASV